MRESRLFARAVLFLAIATLLSAPVWADRVYLRGDIVLKGIVVSESATEVVFEQDMSVKTLGKGQVERIELEPNGDLLLDFAQRSLRNQQYSRAEEYYRRARDAGCSKSVVERGLNTLRMNRNLHMEALLGKALDQSAALVSQRRYASALEKLNGFEERYGTHERLRSLRGVARCHLAVEAMDHMDNTRALELVLLAREDGAPEAVLHQVFGMLQEREGRTDIARREFALARQFRDHSRPDPLLPPLPELPAEVRPRPRTGAVRVVSKDRAEILRLVKVYADKHKLDPALVEAVILCESNFKVDAVSPVGAEGLMQLMPATAKDLKVANSFDAEQNIGGGTLYLRRMLDMFDNREEFALAAYNAGPGTVQFYKGIPPYRETRGYVKKVLAERAKIRGKAQVVRSP